MTAFDLTHDLLEGLFTANSYSLPDDCPLIFVGLRGCLPQDVNDQSFAAAHVVALRDIDYKNMRCTIAQWKPAEKQVAVFPASTVPHIKYILGFKATPPKKSNCLTPGFYIGYRKGMHQPKDPNHWHEAFKQDGQPLAIRRTYNDTVFNNFDNIEISTGCCDNIHCGWTLDVDSESYASAGCQVIMGMPKCEATHLAENKGPWKIFKQNGYASTQSRYPYALFNASEAYRAATSASGALKRLKFGSSGAKVAELQSALSKSGVFSGTPDGSFGKETFDALKSLQMNAFGVGATDCIVGPATADWVGISL